MKIYLQITTKCNMFCGHCMFSCGHQGEDMSDGVFLSFVEFLYKNAPFYRNMRITIGGGEPTVHPYLFDFIDVLLKHKPPDCSIGIVTNGKKTKDAVRLARMAKRGILPVRLSQDDFHEPIDPRVARLFLRKKERKTDLRNTGLFPNSTIELAGRALSLDREKYGRRLKTPGVHQNGWFVKPNGDIHVCSCETSPIIGNVFEGVLSYSVCPLKPP